MRTRRAFTLIETLVVVVVIALAAALGAHSLSSASRSAQWKAAEAAVARFEARARLYARTDAPVEIALFVDGSTLVARARDGATVLVLDLPSSTGATLVDDNGTPIAVLAIDRLGRSRDATYRLEIDGEILSLDVAGLTGQVVSADAIVSAPAGVLR